MPENLDSGYIYVNYTDAGDSQMNIPKPNLLTAGSQITGALT